MCAAMITDLGPESSMPGRATPPAPPPWACEQTRARTAAELADELVDEAWLDQLIASAGAGESRLTGEGGFLPELIKRVLERGLEVERTDHLGYEKGDPAGRGAPNSRNGTTPKTVLTEAGPIGLEVPRDRLGTFTPRLVPKGERRLAGGLDDMIISLYAGGMTVRDIEHHLVRTLGVEVSRETISKITDAVLEEVKAWQARPLDAIYPIIYVDALVVKVRDGAHVMNKAAHIVVGVDTDGIKHVLGIWVQNAEGARFWLQVFTELRNRGVRDVLIACCDGLEGLPEAIETVWPKTVTQTCVVHLIRAAMRMCPDGDRKAVAAALKPIYTAATEDAALQALAAFTEGELAAATRRGRRLGTRLGTVHPFLAFPPQEGRSSTRRMPSKPQLRTPQDHQEPRALPLRPGGGQAALAGHLRHRGQARPRREKERRRKPVNHRTAPGRLVEGQLVTGWKQALNALDIAYPAACRKE